ncbi:hypothetical protein I7I51_02723 [Histoplasma capsulatum]|uniref:Uncharacterized protein n=1 Tax=Ajellomyces capsulatus TaxID=5037 RepID=A0A8A1ML10_AJECA|nr:hypothetical protein I7I51_02723 [Histoplasma capsulatum]
MYDVVVVENCLRRVETIRGTLVAPHAERSNLTKIAAAFAKRHATNRTTAARRVRTEDEVPLVLYIFSLQRTDLVSTILSPRYGISLKPPLLIHCSFVSESPLFRSSNGQSRHQNPK